MQEGHDGDGRDAPITDRERHFKENGEERSQREDSQNQNEEFRKDKTLCSHQTSQGRQFRPGTQAL